MSACVFLEEVRSACAARLVGLADDIHFKTVDELLSDISNPRHHMFLNDVLELQAASNWRQAVILILRVSADTCLCPFLHFFRVYTKASRPAKEFCVPASLSLRARHTISSYLQHVPGSIRCVGITNCIVLLAFVRSADVPLSGVHGTICSMGCARHFVITCDINFETPRVSFHTCAVMVLPAYVCICVLNREYTKRYHRQHVCEPHSDWLRATPPPFCSPVRMAPLKNGAAGKYSTVYASSNLPPGALTTKCCCMC